MSPKNHSDYRHSQTGYPLLTQMSNVPANTDATLMILSPSSSSAEPILPSISTYVQPVSTSVSTLVSILANDYFLVPPYLPMQPPQCIDTGRSLS